MHRRLDGIGAVSWHPDQNHLRAAALQKGIGYGRPLRRLPASSSRVAALARMDPKPLGQSWHWLSMAFGVGYGVEISAR